MTLRPGENDPDDYLTAHVVMENRKDNNEARANELIDRLRTRLSLALPQYMIPAVILPIHEIPLTAHGKVDRKAVQALYSGTFYAGLYQGKRSSEGSQPAERRLVHLWATVLPAHSSTVKPFAPESDFFRLGGNSLLLVKLQSAIKRSFGDAPRLSKLMNTHLSSEEWRTYWKARRRPPDWNQEIEFDLVGEVRKPRSSRDTPKRVPGSAFLSRALRDPWESTSSLT